MQGGTGKKAGQPGKEGKQTQISTHLQKKSKLVVHAEGPWVAASWQINWKGPEADRPTQAARNFFPSSSLLLSLFGQCEIPSTFGLW